MVRFLRSLLNFFGVLFLGVEVGDVLCWFIFCRFNGIVCEVVYYESCLVVVVVVEERGLGIYKVWLIGGVLG